jgi:hypothetical protein
MSKASGITRSLYKKSYNLSGQYDGYFFALGKRKRGDSSSITEQELKAAFEQWFGSHDTKPYESEDEDGVICNTGVFIESFEFADGKKIFIDCSLCNNSKENDVMLLVGEGDA